MKYSNIQFLQNTTYYILVVFEDKNKSGETISNEYKRLGNAERKFKSLVDSGIYERVMIRKEDVFRRSPTSDISISSPYRKWEVA